MEDPILKGLRLRDPLVLDQVYKDCFSFLLKYIQQQKGGRADAEDIFQEAMIVIYRKIKADELHLQSTFTTFFMGVCKYIWRRHQRRNRRTISNFPSDLLWETIEYDLEKQERYQLLREKFHTLSKNCRLILQLFFEQYSMQEIAEVLGYESAGYIKKRKCICQRKLIEAIRSDPRFAELL